MGVAAAHHDGCPPRSRTKIVDDLIDDLQDSVNCDNLTSQESQQSVSINHFTASSNYHAAGENSEKSPVGACTTGNV